MRRFLIGLGKFLLAIVIIAVSFLWYAGFFNPVYISEKSSGPYEAVIIETGVFDDPAEERNKLFKILFDEDIVTNEAVAITPDPFGQNLIRQTGWILTPAQAQEIADIPPPYKLITIPRQERVVADFDYNNSFNIMAGAYVVYRSLKNYCDRESLKPGEMYEIYNDKQSRIFYHLNISQR